MLFEASSDYCYDIRQGRKIERETFLKRQEKQEGSNEGLTKELESSKFFVLDPFNWSYNPAKAVRKDSRLEHAYMREMAATLTELILQKDSSVASKTRASLLNLSF